MTSASVTGWLRRLAKGDHDAAALLWQRYRTALESIAKNRLAGGSLPLDEEDVASSVFIALWQGAEAGKWELVQNRDELWWVLFEITRRKVLRKYSHQSAAKRSAKVESLTPPGESATDSTISLSLIDVRELAPDASVMLKEEHSRLMGLLRDDQLRTIASLKLEGWSHEEIAADLGVSVRTIIRKMNLIRECWAQEIN